MAKPTPTPKIDTGKIPRLPAQLFPVSYQGDSPIAAADIPEILYALAGADGANIRLGTTEDLLTATKFGLNWCYPSYIQKSAQDRSLTIYAASQPGQCGTKSQRQLIRVISSTPIDPKYVFVFGPKPDQSYSTASIRTTSGRVLTINNFYEPVASGFRNMRESFANATTCYNALSCNNLTVQAAVTSQTLADPVSITLAPPTSQTGTGSASDVQAAPPSLAAPILLTGQQTQPLPVTELPAVPPSSVQVYNSYYTSPSQASSSAAKRPTSTYTGPAPKAQEQPSQTFIQNITSQPSTEYNKLRRELSDLQRKSKEAEEEATQAQLVQYVEQTGEQPASECPTTTTKPYYNPDAGFFANLLAEFQYDASRLLAGLRAASV